MRFIYPIKRLITPKNIPGVIHSFQYSQMQPSRRYMVQSHEKVTTPGIALKNQ